MRLNAIALLIVTSLLSLGLTHGQSLTTTLTSNNGQSGNMFDLVATGGTVTIQSFDINLAGGVTDLIEVYALSTPGSYVGNDANPGAWTLIGSATVTSLGTDVATPLGLTLNHIIPAGTTQAFYVTTTASGAINYTDGTLEGAVFATDGVLDFLEGLGVAYPFAGSFTPRVFIPTPGRRARHRPRPRP